MEFVDGIYARVFKRMRDWVSLSDVQDRIRAHKRGGVMSLRALIDGAVKQSMGG